MIINYPEFGDSIGEHEHEHDREGGRGGEVILVIYIYNI